jgi:Family of unknown function (DUF6345)
LANYVGVEWINDYNNLNKLTHEHEDAGGLYDELVNHDGWVGRFNWGNSNNAWEDDFKRTAKGGHAPDWVENVRYRLLHGPRKSVGVLPFEAIPPMIRLSRACVRADERRHATGHR